MADDVTWCWYVWAMIVQRGDPSKSFLDCAGAAASHGPNGRVPPLKQDAWIRMCDKAFKPDSNITLMVDGCPTYREVRHTGIRE
eukprot:13049691-Alexandrium_andersonii.AAC.1